MAAERSDVARTVSALEADLARVRREAEAFGRDLKALRAEKERAEEQERRKVEEARKAQRAEKEARSAEKEAKEQAKALVMEVKKHKEEARWERREREAHICAAYALSLTHSLIYKTNKTYRDGQVVSTLKLQHNKECKGLIVQIRYLKAKFTRESLLRCDLGYQKHYLLVLLSQFEKR
jgi:sRNA-binding protein